MDWVERHSDYKDRGDLGKFERVATNNCAICGKKYWVNDDHYDPDYCPKCLETIEKMESE
jgi:PHP family Zn ribbon phosphoesterase